MQGKRVLVTGAGTGIGRGIAVELARRGCRVAVHYSHSAAGAEATVAEIVAQGGQAGCFAADFRDVGQVQSLAAAVLDHFGGLDVLVNNAGITANVPFDRVTPEQFDTLYGVNIRAMFFLTQALVQALEQSRGSVVNITSIHAYEALREHTVYAGTKGAIVAFTRTLAIELAPRGIRVNACAPGCVHVENYSKALPDFTPEAAGRNIPAGFCGTPADIAKVVAFLASEDARYILGQTLVVDGGTISWMPFSDGFAGPLTGRFGSGYVPGI
jgi:NAD(P)-dependent dehydrogenase (short-subunit alcohol dehydrogenase family)